MKRALAASFTLLFGFSLFLSAQVGTDGSILGTVTDASGAVIPGARVTVTNIETGISKSATADSAGYFSVLALSRGSYSVTVTQAGFATWELQSIQLTAGENKRVSPILQIGATKQQVTVQEAIELLQTEQSGMAVGVEQTQIRELPLNGRDSIQMVELVPGMRYLGITGNTDQHIVQGLGIRQDQTQFTVDGTDHNDPSTEYGMVIPNLESVAQFRVETSNFSAANGRQPLQVRLITKNGTNKFHGSAFEFVRNHVFDAKNYFAPERPKLKRNQFGASFSGPIKKDKSFFFVSMEQNRIRTETVYNAFAINPSLIAGNFPRSLADPLTITTTTPAGLPFPNNQIPQARYSNASKFFIPYLIQPNTTGDRFVGVFAAPDDSTNLLTRFDHQLRPTQRIYGRWTRVAHAQDSRGYKPEIVSTQGMTQHSLGLNFDWTITPRTLLSLGTAFVYSDTGLNSPVVGKENLNEKAGLQGFPSSLMENTIGLPSVTITNYSGFSYPQQVPASFKRETLDEIASLSLVRQKHTVTLGAQYTDRRTNTHHASAAPRGIFAFNGQYTTYQGYTNAFADYVLGYVQNVQRNFPLAAFGVAHAPNMALYVQDDWRVLRSLTLNLGLRLDRWNEKQFVRGCGATFDQERGKVIAGQNKKGQVDLTCQPVGPFLGPATKQYWISAKDAGVPNGLFEASAYLSPRIGVAWRPRGKNDLVVRGAWGVFTSSYQGNYTGSSIIGPPYWLSESITFTKASFQKWETAFPAEPKSFVAPSISAAAYDVKPNVVEQWNVSVQKGIPLLKSAVTLSYVGNRGYDLITKNSLNEVKPGAYANLQNARPYPALGNVYIYYNTGHSWYNSLQALFERRFSQGMSYTLSYAFARNIDDYQTALGATQVTPFAPAGYSRGPAVLERRHILTFNGVYQLPFGRGKRWASKLPNVLNGVVGGWQFSSIYRFNSGQPLTFNVPGTTLGNGYNTRPFLLKDPHVDRPSVGKWFDTSFCDMRNPNIPCPTSDVAFAIPPQYQFGNASIGAVSGPASHTLDVTLGKNFRLREGYTLQFRWEAFNTFNEVNLGNPVTNIGTGSNAGVITSAGQARQMQLALKLMF